MKRKTFRRASFDHFNGVYELTCFYQREWNGTFFHHFVVEHVRDGRCVNRIEIHPYQYQFNLRKTLAAARSLCYGKKALHVKN